MTDAFNKYNSFMGKACNGGCNFSSDTLKVMLTNTAPSATADSVYSGISGTEVASGNGYTTGGNAAALVSFTQSAGTWKLILGVPTTWTASGGSIGPFRYAVLYDATTGNLIGWWDYGSSITLASGEQFQAALDQTNGVSTWA